MKTYALLLLLPALSLPAAAQDIMMGNATAGGRPPGTVEVVGVGDAAELLRSVPRGNPEAKIRGYRINIFTDNTQGADRRAAAMRDRFREMYPGVKVEATYEVPSWKVVAGYFLTADEARMFWGQIKGVFDKAVIASYDIPLAEFAE